MKCCDLECFLFYFEVPVSFPLFPCSSFPVIVCFVPGRFSSHILIVATRLSFPSVFSLCLPARSLSDRFCSCPGFVHVPAWSCLNKPCFRRLSLLKSWFLKKTFKCPDRSRQLLANKHWTAHIAKWDNRKLNIRTKCREDKLYFFWFF